MANANVPPFATDSTTMLDVEYSFGGWLTGRLAGFPTLQTGANAIPPHQPSVNVITAGAAAALTLAAPTAGAQNNGGDDFRCIEVISTTGYAHTVTATGLLATGSASVNVATFAAFAGAGLRLMAYGGKWLVLASTGITFS